MTGSICADCANRKGNVCKTGNRMVYELYECPAGYTQEEVDKAQAVSAKVRAKPNPEKKKAATRKPKNDSEKEEIIRYIASALESFTRGGVEITNKSKLIEFKIGENHYKLDLIKSRTSKK